MKVTVFCPDQELAPLLERHLANCNQSVATMIVDAIKLYNEVEKAMASNENAALALVDRRSNSRYGVNILQAILAERKDIE